MATANENLLDASISHQIGLYRLSTATVRKIIAQLNRTEEDLVAQILKYDFTEVSGTYSRKRLEKMLDAVKTITAEAYGQIIDKDLDGDLKALSAYEGEFQLSMLNRVTTIKLDLVSPTPSQLWAAVNSRPFQGKYLKDWYAGLEQGAQARLRDSIRTSFTEGETIEQTIRRIRGTRALQYKDGILEISRRAAEMVVRTSMNHTANAARNHLYDTNSSVIKGVRWVSTLDGRTTMVCAARDGTVYPPNSGPRPPAHPNCRSTTAPVLKSWKEMGINLSEAPEGTRASMDGQVPASSTYDSWLRKKDVAFQEEVLGVTKAKLFRNGELTLDRFVDRAGVEYTLDELRKREAQAFERAGL